MPLFSIIIPSYCNAKYLPRCLDSLKFQNFEDWEALIVDDASPDDSASIVRHYAASDCRYRLIEKKQNEGLHLARRTGVEEARGKWVLFLDADDEIAKNSLLALSEVLPSEEDIVIHFGLKCIAEGGMTDETAHAFEEWANGSLGYFERNELIKAIYERGENQGRDWHVTHRLYSLSLVKQGFSLMTNDRLERAEDGYEQLVLASLTKGEITHNEIVGYHYFMGLGVTSSSKLSADNFVKAAKSMNNCVSAAREFAQSTNSGLLVTASDGFAEQIYDAIANEWYERVDASDKNDAIKELVNIIGGSNTASQLMRFVRDCSYADLKNSVIISGNEQYLTWYEIADSLIPPENLPEFNRIEHVAAARKNVLSLQNRAERMNSYEQQRIRIFVTTHKDVDIFESDILQPVQVGKSQKEWHFPWAFHDDEGENISSLNDMYCELTTQYWAWKNIDAEYLGFCHYRRYFNFSDKRYDENVFGEIIDTYINGETQKRYGLDDKTIATALQGYDVITTEFKDLSEFPGDADTPLEQYKAAPYLHIEDLERVIAILKEMYPDYSQDADTFLLGNKSCFCNMYIMRRDIFRAYCAWMFPILERFVKETDFSLYSTEALRTPGHLSERLFNIYFIHQMRINSGWRTKQLQCVHFDEPERQVYKLPIPQKAALDKPIIPVVFAADDAYVPMISTTIQSLLSNASDEYFYDIVVLTRNIFWDYREKMHEFFADSKSNVELRFHDVSNVVNRYELSTNNEHISTETYYRFLIQEVLPDYDKVIYLDSDLIVEGDISELYNVDLEDNLLAAVRDIDYLGNLNMNNGERLTYSKEILEMKNPYDYFQAGVLVLNTAEMREAFTVGEWLNFASEPNFIYDDQDVLNAHCEGRVLYLEPEWNVMHNCGNRIENVFSFAPAEIYSQYTKARQHPKIRHYAGFEKPWNTYSCDWAEEYWHYARITPFYEKLILLASGINSKDKEEEAAPPKAVSPYNPIRLLAAPLLPQGSERREKAKAFMRRLKGLE